MDLQTFWDNFDVIAAAPGGVARLRELILDLAVRGKLVPQDPADEPADKLLEQIQNLKKQLKKNGLKKITSSKDVDPDEVEYEVPPGWLWTNLASLGLVNPRNEVEDELEVAFVPMKLIPQVYGESVSAEIRPWGEVKKGFTHFAERDVVLAKITPCFQNGKAAVMNGLKNKMGAGTTELHVFRPLDQTIDPNYVFLYLKSPGYINNGIPRMTGTAGQKRVPNDYFSYSPFPLPPLAEQKRIVAKVDELMALCDRYEAAKVDRDTLRTKLRASAIDALMNAETDEALKDAWSIVQENWIELSQVPEDIEYLRKTIFSVAVRGKLEAQQAIDGEAQIDLKVMKSRLKELQKNKQL